eukprot:TRINITY_DN5985_c0_g1_i2.p1 TRINITY_DN5985_c0_g1~~TRINITY_DN5985_c0_g1_i2.p1  ORF type:complete len:155 (+),score=6.66 TRINITY_DN5985_c0_g1_i2:27-467(+)
MSGSFLFEDIFTVKEKDPHGKRFDRVSRFVCTGQTHDIELAVDINTQLYPLELNDRFTLCLATTLHEDGSPDDGEYDQSGRSNLADGYDYVMHGKVYRIEEQDQGQQLSVFVSFGGLLMRLRGDTSSLSKPGLDIDSSQYLLMRKA